MFGEVSDEVSRSEARRSGIVFSPNSSDSISVFSIMSENDINKEKHLKTNPQLFTDEEQILIYLLMKNSSQVLDASFLDCLLPVTSCFYILCKNTYEVKIWGFFSLTLISR